MNYYKFWLYLVYLRIISHYLPFWYVLANSCLLLRLTYRHFLSTSICHIHFQSSECFVNRSMEISHSLCRCSSCGIVDSLNSVNEIKFIKQPMNHSTSAYLISSFLELTCSNSSYSFWLRYTFSLC